MTRRLRVDLGALRNNYLSLVDRNPQCRVGAVVKADAYGLGVEGILPELSNSGCRDLFVATLEEGVKVRALQPDTRVFVFEGPHSRNACDEYRRHSLVPVLNHPDQWRLWRNFRDCSAALHVDTGMHRLGFPPDGLPEDIGTYRIELLMTHLACADSQAHPLNAAQIEGFAKLRARHPELPVSLGASAGAWLGGTFAAGLLRPGIGLYGGNPFSDRPNPFAAVAAFEARVLQLRTVARGESVGYGASHRMERDSVVAVVGAGYADGIPRVLSNLGNVRLRGARCPIVGHVSMDLTQVDVTDAPSVALGDWAEIFGSHITLDEYAERADTIGYEALCRISARVPRLYEQGTARQSTMPQTTD